MGVDIKTRMGRPRIGPKVQTAVPDHVAEYIQMRAFALGVEAAVVAREMLVEAFTLRSIPAE